jgi:hypothetical protein
VVISELDDVQYDLEVDGELVRRQLARKVWDERGWATVAICFEERAGDGTWKAPKIALLRLRRMHDAWKKQAGITLSVEEAHALGVVIAGWPPVAD